MGIFSKVKNILFDEDVDLTEQIKITPEMRNEEPPVKFSRPEVQAPKKEEMPVNHVTYSEPVNEMPKEIVREKEPVRNDSYPFLDFDADEFNNHKTVKKEVVHEAPPAPKRQLNVLEIERKKRIEKRTDYGRYEKTEITETSERRKFKPSPIISPVYGILNQDYEKDDIKQRKYSDKVDINEVRNKAFGEVKEEKRVVPRAQMPRREARPSYYEERETETRQKPEPKRVKNIDELLEGTSDIMVDMRREIEGELENNIDNRYHEEKENTREMVVPSADDTLENDLFDLIDSMYDSKEEE